MTKATFFRQTDKIKRCNAIHENFIWLIFIRATIDQRLFPTDQQPCAQYQCLNYCLMTHSCKRGQHKGVTIKKPAVENYTG